MEFFVQLLGTNSALPIHNRFPTSQYVHVNDQHFLVDCGEGTQIQLGKYKIKRNKIDTIFISHLHGDHVYGLPGLLGSYNHFNRIRPIQIYGPPGLRDFVEMAIEIAQAKLSYELSITELPPETTGEIKFNNGIKVQYFPLKHRITNFGFRFNYQSPERNIKKEAIKKFNLTVPMIKAAKRGEDILTESGNILLNNLLTLPQMPTLSYAFCSDTVFDTDLIDHVNNVDLLYHETTYLDGMEKEAKERMHSTLGQAIFIAEKAQAGVLLTGHYSSRYTDLKEFKAAADNANITVIIGEEGEKYYIHS